MFVNKKCVPCQGGIPPLEKQEIEKFKHLVDSNWKVIGEKKLEREFEFLQFLDGIKFTNKIAELAESEGHHPYIHINFKIIKVILFTHKIDGLHENDFLMAAKIDSIYN